MSHLLREIESALRDVLEPIVHYEGRAKAKGTTTHEHEIRIILGELGLSETEGPGAAWLDIVQTGLHALAHRRSLDGPRPFDENFRSLWVDVETVLDAILERFESRYLDLHDEADRLCSKLIPSKADLKYLKDNLPNNPVMRQYFFGNLKHPGWLQPLADEGFFSDPPPSIHDQQTGAVSYPYWPVTHYLKRMAARSDVDEAVVTILQHVPEVENRIVHEALAEIVLELPVDRAVALAERVVTWVKDDTFTSLPVKAVAFAVRLLANNRADEAFFLLHAVLDPTRFPSGELMRARSVDTYWYSEALERAIPEFTKHRPQETLVFLSDLLDHAIRKAENDSQGKLYSASRRTIEQAQRWRQYEVVDMLVDAVRDAALAIVRGALGSMRLTVEVLESRELEVFRRIALYLLGSEPSMAPEMVENRILRRATFDRWHREPEYVRLVRVAFTDLSPNARDQILCWIEQGPSPESYKPRSNEDFAALKESWQRFRLKPIRDQLPSEWQQRLGTIKQTETDDPDDSKDEDGRWVGPTSPRSAEELGALRPEELAEFLRTWRPKAGWRESSPEGLGRLLTEAVASSPGPVAQHARIFIGLEPTYVRAIVQGLEQGLKNGHVFEWPGVLDLCEWVVAQPRDDERGRSDWDSDPGWSWSRKAVASLIARGVDCESGKIPIANREQVWRVLEPVTWDQDPDPERDTDRDDDDAFHVAINSVRGEAMIAVVRYAVWVEMYLRETSGGLSGVAAMPEVEQSFIQHLDCARESSPAVRSVFGEAFPLLHWLDADWAEAHVDSVFKLPVNSTAARGAWSTYLRFCRPYDDLFGPLRACYIDAVRALDQGEELEADIDSVEYHLATHVVAFYWRGIDGAETLVHDLLLRGGASLRRATFDFIGQSLMNTEGEVPPESLSRLRSLWEWWRDEAPARRLLGKETEAFGWWYASEQLDTAWANEQALGVLRQGRMLEPDNVVVERLAMVVKDAPVDALKILDGLLENLRDQWGFYGWRDECKDILHAALASGDTEAVGAARRLEVIS